METKIVEMKMTNFMICSMRNLYQFVALFLVTLMLLYDLLPELKIYFHSH